MRLLNLVFLLFLNFQITFAQSPEMIEGKLYWNLSQFEGYYGLEDSLVLVMENHIHHLASEYGEKEEMKVFLKEYRFLTANNLLYEPCKFLLTEDKKPIRVYFTEADYLRIKDSGWFPSMKKNIQTFVKMKVNRLKDGVYFCDEIVDIRKARE